MESEGGFVICILIIWLETAVLRGGVGVLLLFAVDVERRRCSSLFLFSNS